MAAQPANASPARAVVVGLAAVIALAAGIWHKWEDPATGPALVAYPDPATGGAPWTICSGHTGPEVKQGTRFTPEQCAAATARDLAIANGHVRRCITRRPIPPSVEAALTSATGNIGPAVVCNSTLRVKANAGDWRGACRELTHARRRLSDGSYVEHGWTYAAGVRYRGLINRRTDERRLCERDLAA